MTRPYALAGLPSDLLTSPREGERRLAVDPQQTSFAEYRQYRLFFGVHGFAGALRAALPVGHQLVVRLEAAAGFEAFVRRLELWDGGLLYSVFGAGSVSVALAPLEPVFPANLAAGHPASQMSFQWAAGPNIFTPTSAPSNGTALKTDGNVNRASSNLSSNDERSGFPAGTVAWLVFESFGSAPAQFLYNLAWQEDRP
jgi:hypothetical protein